MMMQEVGKLSFFSRFLNQPFRIYIRHTEEYMTEEFQKTKYIIAEAGSLEEIKEDWEMIESEILPIIKENILSKKRISLNDLKKLLLNLKKRSGDFGELSKVDFESVGLKFNILKMLNPKIRNDEAGFLIEFKDIQPEMSIFIRPIHTKESLQTIIEKELKDYEFQFQSTHFNPYYYESKHLIYDTITLGFLLTYEEKTVKCWNMYIIMNRFLYKFMVMSHSEIFNLASYMESLTSLKFYTPSISIYEHDGILFGYDNNLKLSEQVEDIYFNILLQEKEKEVGFLKVYFHDKLNVVLDKIIEMDLNIGNSIEEFLNEKAYIFEFLKDNQTVVHMVFIKKRIYHFKVASYLKTGIEAIHSVFQTFKIIED